MCARPLALQSGRTTRDVAKQLQFALRKQHERIAIRSRESGVWLRIPSSAPSKMRFYEGNSLGFEILSIANSRAENARKHRLFVNYLSSLPSDGGIPLPIHEHGRRDSMSIGTQST